MILWYLLIAYLQICSYHQLGIDEVDNQLKVDLFLPRDQQICVSLQKGISKKYYFRPEAANSSLSIIVTPCNSDFFWSISFQLNHSYIVLLKNELVNEQKYHFIKNAQQGLYVINVMSVQNTSIFLFVNTEINGPTVLLNSNQEFLKVKRIVVRKKLILNWRKSLVDPHMTEYYVVLSTKKNYTNLCSAFYDKFPFNSLISKNNTIVSSLTLSPLNYSKYEMNNSDLEIFWSKHTKYVISNLDNVKQYFLNLYAVNKVTNFSYLYGSKLVQKELVSKSKSLKDGVLVVINPRKAKKFVYKFKIKKNQLAKSLWIYLIPCAVVVDFNVIENGTNILQRKNVQEFERISITNLRINQRYYFWLTVSNQMNLNSYSKIELLVTMRNLTNIFTPLSLKDRQLNEYKSMRTCNSTQIAWKTLENASVQYCIILRQGHLNKYINLMDYYSCTKKNVMKIDKSYLSKKCLTNVDNGNVMTYLIANIKPKTTYVVQVIMKAKNSISSYHLLEITTKSKCK